MVDHIEVVRANELITGTLRAAALIDAMPNDIRVADRSRWLCRVDSLVGDLAEQSSWRDPLLVQLALEVYEAMALRSGIQLVEVGRASWSVEGALARCDLIRQILHGDYAEASIPIAA